jgi:hypothetical protein
LSRSESKSRPRSLWPPRPLLPVRLGQLQPRQRRHGVPVRPVGGARPPGRAAGGAGAGAARESGSWLSAAALRAAALAASGGPGAAAAIVTAGQHARLRRRRSRGNRGRSVTVPLAVLRQGPAQWPAAAGADSDHSLAGCSEPQAASEPACQLARQALWLACLAAACHCHHRH